ncbi:ABC1 kinase family protein [Micrococcus endophyticus]|uniref:ABC1 kinase family protein n=1 Tax=Micrococcus endophyticus TaxID=455343 RepID=UPI002002F6EA|nr:AarF/UbiB family protein [Micrococcus endophyticus]MCK6090747.1 phosphotransferase [Micrococcus endophyticus]
MPSRLHRSREIALVLGRNGLQATALAAGLGRWLPAADARTARDAVLRPDMLVDVFEQLGTTFVKLGQLISARPDMFPESICTAFARLTDDTTPVPFEAMAATVLEDFGASVDELYAWFDPVPLATASIGQAHRARLHDGRDVVVKIRKPGVVEQVRTDLEILRTVASRLSRASRALQDMDVVSLVDEFDRALRAELDYLVEARACEQIAENLRDVPGVRVPWVDWATTSSRVLTMEEITGFRVDDLASLDAAGIDRADLSYRAAEVLMGMVFEDGLFHADPHPGNVFIEADGGIGFIDFGSVGRISSGMRRRFSRMAMALVRQDPDGLVRALVAIAPPRGDLDRRALRLEVSRITGRLEGRDLSDIRVDQLVGQIFGIVRRHRLALPPELVQLFRMLIIVDGLGKRLHPGFDYTRVLNPFAVRVAGEELDPRRVAGRIGQAGLAAAELGLDLPEYARKVIDHLEDGGLDVTLRTGELEPLVARMERTGDRVVAALVVAAMITGGTNVLVAYKDRLGRFAGPVVAAGGAALTGGSAYLAWTGRPRRMRRRPRG